MALKGYPTSVYVGRASSVLNLPAACRMFSSDNRATATQMTVVTPTDGEGG